MSWQSLASESHYQTAIHIRDALQDGDVVDAQQGLEELITALSRSEKRALKNQLVRLMLHIIKWQCQSERRSLSWLASINDARDEIIDIQEETPSLSNAVIQDMWEKCFVIAKRDAEAEMNKKATTHALSWDEVFTMVYRLEF